MTDKSGVRIGGGVNFYRGTGDPSTGSPRAKALPPPPGGPAALNGGGGSNDNGGDATTASSAASTVGGQVEMTAVPPPPPPLRTVTNNPPPIGNNTAIKNGSIKVNREPSLSHTHYSFYTQGQF